MPFAKSYIFPDSSLPALNLATFLALILITAPVCGLRPLRAALLLTENVPKPTSVTLPPPFKVLVTASTKESKEALACVLVTPASSAILAINSALFIIILFDFLTVTNIEAFSLQENYLLIFFAHPVLLKPAIGKGFKSVIEK